MIVLFNKPFHVLSQFTDKEGIADERENLSHFIDLKDVYPAGRLDLDSEGLMILTDNGKLQSRISSPKFKVEKRLFFIEKLFKLNGSFINKLYVFSVFSKNSNI